MKQLKYIIRITLTLLFFILSFSIIFNCGENVNDPSKNIIFPDSKVSYSQHVQPLFNYRCALPGCHDEDPQNTRLSLTSYYSATYYPGIIVPGLPDNSVLIQRLDGRLMPRMPFSRDTITNNQYNGLKTWIKEGALNN